MVTVDPFDASSKLCAACIGDKNFKKWVNKHGYKGKCDFVESHADQNRTITVEAFALEVDKYFRDKYCIGEEVPNFSDPDDKVYYDQQGEPYKEILTNDLEADEPVIEAISEYLPDLDHIEIKDGGEPFYDYSANYEPISDVEKRHIVEQEDRWYEERYTLEWKNFCEDVQYKNRFFRIKKKLDELFGKPKEYENGKIRPVYVLTKGIKLFRARLLDDGFDETVLSKNPSKELGAPPRDKTKAGRMNVELIPAFYAAFSSETAIAEIRPGIGERVAVGEFIVEKEIRVFDFTVFSKAVGDDWRESFKHTRYDFITQMQSEISKPILPFQKQREYIPTQIVAEYLKEYFKCDAVIYESSMSKDDKIDNRNIVLLNKGKSFVDTKTALLKYVDHTIHDIRDVTYLTFNNKLF